jgi:hypothetical protein
MGRVGAGNLLTDRRPGSYLAWLLAASLVACSNGSAENHPPSITRADVLTAVEDECSTRPAKGVSYAEAAEAWATRWPLSLRDFAYGKVLCDAPGEVLSRY